MRNPWRVPTGAARQFPVPWAPLDSAYATTKNRLVRLMQKVGVEVSEIQVPATPQWMGGDVIAHMTGLASTAVSGTIPTGRIGGRVSGADPLPPGVDAVSVSDI